MPRPPLAPRAAALALALALAAACRPQPASPAAAPPPLDRAQCTALASSARSRCGADEAASLAWCMTVGRLAEVAACAPQARRALDCAARVAARCDGASCCAAGADCDDAYAALDHCERGYCGGHAGNPDCYWTALDASTPRSLLSPPPPAPPAAPEPAADADPAAALAAELREIRAIDDTHYEVRASLVDQILMNPMIAAKSMRIVPAMKNGQPDGFKLFAIRRDSLWARLGFANGDTVQIVNGVRLDSPDRALEVYTSLRQTRSLEIDLERRGAPLRLFIQIKD